MMRLEGWPPKWQAEDVVTGFFQMMERREAVRLV